MLFNEKMTKSSEFGEEFNEQQKVIEQEEKLIEHDINNVDNNIENNTLNYSDTIITNTGKHAQKLSIV